VGGALLGDQQIRRNLVVTDLLILAENPALVLVALGQ